ncbi:MAG: hypothetical protein IIA87_05755 [Nanoarchaeota archaeon]|nr:hypothetical protein [Nanoarchaeota archaeon]
MRLFRRGGKQKGKSSNYEENIARAQRVMAFGQPRVWYAHGTNGKAFEGMLEVNGYVFPREILEGIGRDVVSGEGMGAMSPGYVHAINLSYVQHDKGYIREAVKYATKKAVGGCRIAPSTIDERIEEAKAFLKYVNDLPNLNEHNRILKKAAEERILPDQLDFEKRFLRMSQIDKDEWEQLSKIPVVVLGTSIAGQTPVLGSYIPADVGVKSIEIRVASTTPESMSMIEEMIKRLRSDMTKEGSRDQIVSVPIDSLEDLQRSYLNVYHAAVEEVD